MKSKVVDYIFGIIIIILFVLMMTKFGITASDIYKDFLKFFNLKGI